MEAAEEKLAGLQLGSKVKTQPSISVSEKIEPQWAHDAMMDFVQSALHRRVASRPVREVLFRNCAWSKD